MDFTEVELSADDAAFQRELRTFLSELVTDEVRLHDRQTGDNFHEGVHLALGARGYLQAEFNSGTDSGFSRVRRRIWDLERRRAHVPWVTWGTTVMVARAVAAFGKPELVDEVLPRVFDGTARMCLGYTEPEGGSDVATCKTRAVQDGDHWVINGSKMFTTGAHNCQYVFLLTNSDPDAPKHKSLSMFLVPLDLPGIEIQGIRTVDGDRTNIVYYTDVRVPEKYLLGEANGGWTVLRGPLDAEHGAAPTEADGLSDVSIMAHQAGVHGRRGRCRRRQGRAGRRRREANGRRRCGRLPPRSRRGALGDIPFHAKHFRASGPGPDDARHRTRSDGSRRGCLGAARRHRRGRR